MIADNIKNFERYAYMGENIKKVFEFLSSLTLATPEGVYNFDGGITVKVCTETCKPMEDCLLEAHKRYADIHFPIDESEGIVIYDKEDCEPSCEYNPEKDCIFYKAADKDSDKLRGSFKLGKGDFLFVYPQEIHQPLISQSGKVQKLRKAIVKIPFQTL